MGALLYPIVGSLIVRFQQAAHLFRLQLQRVRKVQKRARFDVKRRSFDSILHGYNVVESL